MFFIILLFFGVCAMASHFSDCLTAFQKNGKRKAFKGTENNKEKSK